MKMFQHKKWADLSAVHGHSLRSEFNSEDLGADADVVGACAANDICYKLNW